MAAVWSHINTLILLLVLCALLAVIGMLASGVRGGPLDPPGGPAATDSVRLPGTPVSGPTVIDTSGHYYLTRNIFANGAQAAIVISASSVSLDLGGFAIVGTDSTSQQAVGIDIGNSNNNIVIRNGLVRDHLIGINADGATFVTIQDVQAYSNLVGIELGADSVVRDSTISRNGAAGLVVYGDSNYVHDNLVSGNSESFLDRRDIQIEGSHNVLTGNVAPSNADATTGKVVVSGDSNFMDRNYIRQIDFTLTADYNNYYRGGLCYVTGSNTNSAPDGTSFFYENTLTNGSHPAIRPERNDC